MEVVKSVASSGWLGWAQHPSCEPTARFLFVRFSGETTITGAILLIRQEGSRS